MGEDNALLFCCPQSPWTGMAQKNNTGTQCHSLLVGPSHMSLPTWRPNCPLGTQAVPGPATSGWPGTLFPAGPLEGTSSACQGGPVMGLPCGRLSSGGNLCSFLTVRLVRWQAPGPSAASVVGHTHGHALAQEGIHLNHPSPGTPLEQGP